MTQIILFGAVVVAALILDLYSHKKDQPISLKNAILWSAFWVFVSIVFAGYIYTTQSAERASLFLSGYFLEKSLSVDNLFVFMAIFSNFAINDKYQHRVLYFGIIGALILRFIFIGIGTSLLLVSKWVLVAFGVFVLWSAWKMLQSNEAAEDGEEDYTNHWSVRLTKKIFNVHPKIQDHDFFKRIDGKLLITPLFLCLVAVEIADVMFAFDSVPAVISITQDPYLVYTSNIFAILGLRSMYFLLSAAKRYLVHLEKGVILLLVFIGVKMILSALDILHISPNLSLVVVFVCLSGGIAASYFFPEKEEAN